MIGAKEGIRELEEIGVPTLDGVVKESLSEELTLQVRLRE